MICDFVNYIVAALITLVTKRTPLFLKPYYLIVMKNKVIRFDAHTGNSGY